jgi:hypothetical protein
MTGRRVCPLDAMGYRWVGTTMAHLASVYPFHADAGFGERRSGSERT